MITNDIWGALQLMVVGMLTVFCVLLIVIGLGTLLIKLVNKYAPEEVVNKKPVAMVSSVVACGNSAPESAQNTGSETSTTAAGETQAEETATSSDVTDTITIMVPPITGDYVDLLDGWIKEFNQDYPNITIEVIATSWDDHTEKLS